MAEGSMEKMQQAPRQRPRQPGERLPPRRWARPPVALVGALQEAADAGKAEALQSCDRAKRSQGGLDSVRVGITDSTSASRCSGAPGACAGTACMQLAIAKGWVQP